MSWTYEQSTGRLLHNGVVVATGYSGHPPHVNDPAAQGMENEGPIPQGGWTIGKAFTHAMCGPVALRLVPDPKTKVFGRDGFLIHGPAADDHRSSSHGCIILARPVRLQIDGSGDNALFVVA